MSTNLSLRHRVCRWLTGNTASALSQASAHTLLSRRATEAMNAALVSLACDVRIAQHYVPEPQSLRIYLRWHLVNAVARIDEHDADPARSLAAIIADSARDDVLCGLSYLPRENEFTAHDDQTLHIALYLSGFMDCQLGISSQDEVAHALEDSLILTSDNVDLRYVTN